MNESVIGTRFVGRIVGRTTVQFVPDPDDPFPERFQLHDTWGAGAREALLGRPA
ncbi:MAG: hypothetical protein ACRDN8_06010 [Thermoleophilaceae bacterium]